MAKRRFLAAVLLGMAVVAGGLAIRAMHPGRPSHSHPSGRAVYYCPMHPGYTSDRPGECPICHMSLVKKELEPSGPPEKETAPAGYAAILLSPQKRQMIGVTTAPARRQRLTKTIRTVGQIAYDPELYQAQQEYLQVLRLLREVPLDSPEIPAQGHQVAEAARMRLRLMGLEEEFIDEVAEWEGPDERLLLKSSSGEVWLYAPVYEFELPYVRSGQTVRVEIPSVPGKVLEGLIRSIDPILDPMTRSARARAVLTDPDGILRPGMYVDASIQVGLGEVLSVPEEAVFDTGTRTIIFIDKGEGILEPRTVTVGAKAGGYYALEAGVTEGEVVVTSGNFLIDSESRLKAVLEGAGEGGGHQHGQ